MIEKNIPIPNSQTKIGQSKYPFAQMQVGDSILASGPHPERACNSAYQYGKRFAMKFAVRRVENGYRIWRIK